MNWINGATHSIFRLSTRGLSLWARNHKPRISQDSAHSGQRTLRATQRRRRHRMLDESVRERERREPRGAPREHAHSHRLSTHLQIFQFFNTHKTQKEKRNINPREVCLEGDSERVQNTNTRVSG